MVHEDEQISEAEVAAFADGSLPPRRRAHVAARVERSSELRVLVGEQRAALAAVRALDAPAPARLRARLQPEPSRLPSRPRARLRPLVLAVAAAIAVLLAILLVVLLVVLPPQGRRNGPAVLEIGRNSLLPPFAPAIHRAAA
jgi:anti-sigma factor RsiW